MKAEPEYFDSLNLISGEYSVQEDPVFETQRTKGTAWAVVGISASIFAIIASLFLVISSVMFFAHDAIEDFAMVAMPLGRACLVVCAVSIPFSVFALVSNGIAKRTDITGDLTTILRFMANIALGTMIIGLVLFGTSALIYNWANVVNAFASLSSRVRTLFVA